MAENGRTFRLPRGAEIEMNSNVSRAKSPRRRMRARSPKRAQSPKASVHRAHVQGSRRPQSPSRASSPPRASSPSRMGSLHNAPTSSLRSPLRRNTLGSQRPASPISARRVTKN